MHKKSTLIGVPFEGGATTSPCDLLSPSVRISLVFAQTEVIGTSTSILRVKFIMAVPAGRSVVFVTGNAKKLEEVGREHFKELGNFVLTLFLIF